MQMPIQSSGTAPVFTNHLLRLRSLMLIVRVNGFLIILLGLPLLLLHHPLGLSNRPTGAARGTGKSHQQEQNQEKNGTSLHPFSCFSTYKDSTFSKNNYICGMKNKRTLLLILLLTASLQGCKDVHENPNYPNAIINITINLNQIDYYDLRVVSGYTYLTSDPMSTSRGLIVYRLSQDEFRAYDRLPPNNPDCRDNNGNLTRLVVDFPFVVDNCNDIKYNIINGDIFEGDGIYPLIQYRTSFDGYEVHIFN